MFDSIDMQYRVYHLYHLYHMYYLYHIHLLFGSEPASSTMQRHQQPQGSAT